MTKLVLIDGNAIMHRAFHALPPLTTSSGEPINAVYGFISILLNIIQNLKPTHIAVCFDRPEPTFRKKEFVGYQAHRPEMDKGLSSQFEKVYEVIKAFRAGMYSKAGFEADDVIGTIAKEAKVDEVVIVTGDRDILQLVNEKVRVFMPTKGVSEGKLFGEKEVKEKLGVGPQEVVDYKALVGDSSDNYPGVAGIGPKTAMDLIVKYGSLENIYNNLNEIKKSVANKLEAGREMGILCKKLATIKSDVDMDFKLADTDSWKVDSDEVINLFKSFGFKTLTERVKKLGPQFAKEKQMSLL